MSKGLMYPAPSKHRHAKREAKLNDGLRKKVGFGITRKLSQEEKAKKKKLGKLKKKSKKRNRMK